MVPNLPGGKCRTRVDLGTGFTREEKGRQKVTQRQGEQ